MVVNTMSILTAILSLLPTTTIAVYQSQAGTRTLLERKLPTATLYPDRIQQDCIDAGISPDMPYYAVLCWDDAKHRREIEQTVMATPTTSLVVAGNSEAPVPSVYQYGSAGVDAYRGEPMGGLTPVGIMGLLGSHAAAFEADTSAGEVVDAPCVAPVAFTFVWILVYIAVV